MSRGPAPAPRAARRSRTAPSQQRRPGRLSYHLYGGALARETQELPAAPQTGTRACTHRRHVELQPWEEDGSPRHARFYIGTCCVIRRACELRHSEPDVHWSARPSPRKRRRGVRGAGRGWGGSGVWLPPAPSSGRRELTGLFQTYKPEWRMFEGCSYLSQFRTKQSQCCFMIVSIILRL